MNALKLTMQWQGSSPLAQGTQQSINHRLPGDGLIPARAGNTAA